MNHTTFSLWAQIGLENGLLAMYRAPISDSEALSHFVGETIGQELKAR